VKDARGLDGPTTLAFTELACSVQDLSFVRVVYGVADGRACCKCHIRRRCMRGVVTAAVAARRVSRVSVRAATSGVREQTEGFTSALQGELEEALQLEVPADRETVQ
jgi:hypothetical protein